MPNADDLFRAVNEGQLSLFREGLEQEPALARARDARDISLILHARYRGRFDMVEALLEVLADDLDVFEASALGRTDRLARLVAQEPLRVNAYAADGFTPLQLATFFAQPDAVRLLLQRGAEIEAIAKNPMNLRAIHSAAAGGSVEIVNQLLQRGADPNARQHGGWTALHAAAAAGRADMVRSLMAHGAAPHLTNDDGKTAHDLAVAKGHAAVVHLLSSSDSML